MGPVVSAVAAVGGLLQQRKAVRSQERAAAAQAQAVERQERQQEVAAAASRRRSVRSAQVQRARALASAQALGATGGSAIAGGTASLRSQLGTNLGFQTQMSGLSREISGFSQQAGVAMGQARRASNMASLYGGVGQFAGQFDSFEDFTGQFTG